MLALGIVIIQGWSPQRDIAIPLKASYWYLSEACSHTTLQKVRCYVVREIN